MKGQNLKGPLRRGLVLLFIVFLVGSGVWVEDAGAYVQADLDRLLSTNECPNCDLSSITTERGKDFKKANLSGANLNKAEMRSAWLDEANLSGANLDHARLSVASLVGANLTNANLTLTFLYMADLSGADLTGATMIEAYLNEGSLSGATLIDCNMTSAQLREADFSGADLTGADLTKAILYKASLSGAILKNVKLVNATLEKANLTAANLRGADLTGADLTNATLTGATWTNGSKCLSGSLGKCVTSGSASTLASFPSASLTPKLSYPETEHEGLDFKTRYYTLFEGERPLLAIETSGLSAMVFEGVLRYGTTYQYYVLDISTTDEVMGLFGPTTFTTPEKPEEVDVYGNLLIGQGLRNAQGQSISLVDTKLSTLIRGGAGLLSQLGVLEAIQTAGGAVADVKGYPLALMNMNDVRVVRSQGGMGKEIVFAASDANLMATIKPLTSEGYSLDANGTLKPDLAVTPSWVSLPLGLFDFSVSLDTSTNRSKVIIVPSMPFSADTKWYKVLADGTLAEYPHFQVDANGNGVLTLFDNDEYDKNPAFGIIRDPGGPGVATVSGTGSGGGCFIATAAYGSYLHPSVEILKSFRDKILMTNRLGKSFVAWYYRVSRPIADAITQNSTLRAGMRLMLLPAIGLSFLCLKVGVIPTLFLLLVFGSLVTVGIRRARLRLCPPKT